MDLLRIFEIFQGLKLPKSEISENEARMRFYQYSCIKSKVGVIKLGERVVFGIGGGERGLKREKVQKRRIETFSTFLL